jgi:hypothetical protein
MASHAGVRIDEDVYEKVMHDSGCATSYFLLEQCLAESGRKWTKCQEQLRSWKTCMAAVKAKREVAVGTSDADSSSARPAAK